MMHYKSLRLIDGKPIWVIVENGKIINKNPSKDELNSLDIEKYRNRQQNCDRCGAAFNKVSGNPYKEKNLGTWTGRYICQSCYDKVLDRNLKIHTKRRKKIYYNRTNTCDRCGNKLIQKVRREYDTNGNWTEKWLCIRCYKKDYDREVLLSDRRTGNINPNCSSAKGDLFEELTCTWRGVKMLSRELDSFNLPYDHSRDPELGIIGTKGSFYITESKYEWGFDTSREHGKDIDNIICYCVSNDGYHIKAIYIFPKEEIMKRYKIDIYESPTRRKVWYEQYRIKDEGTLKIVNDIWSDINDRNL